MHDLSWVRAQWEGGRLSAIAYNHHSHSSMPSTAQRKKRRQNLISERHMREDAEARNAMLQDQIRVLTEKPPAPRPGISTIWDWRCSCGRLVYAGKRSCDICGAARAYSGTTVTGSLRGVLQTTQVATTALGRQQRVPGMAPPSYAAVLRAPSRAVQQEHHKEQRGGNQPTRAAAQPEPTKRNKDGRKDEPAKAAESDTPLSAKLCFDAENELPHDEDDHTTFEDADADPKVLRFRHINLCRKIESKQKQLDKQHEAIQEHRDEMARQQAKLVELQAEADGTVGKIRELQEKSTSIAQQIARIEESRKIGQEPNQAPTAEQAVPPETQAAECLGKAAAALQGFQAQSPHIQLLLQQFVTFIDKLRAGESVQAVDPKQCTLQQAFASSAATLSTPKGDPKELAQPAAGSSTVAVPCFDISDSQPEKAQKTETAEESAGPMAVVGECLGDKRKREALDESEAEQPAKAPLNTVESSQPGQNLGTPMQVPLLAVPAFVPQSRAELRVALELRNKKQCEERKSRTEAQHQKSCPY